MKRILLIMLVAFIPLIVSDLSMAYADNSNTESKPIADRTTEAHIQEIWQTFRNSIIKRDFETALSQVVPTNQERYMAIFNNPSKDIVTRLKEINRLEISEITERTAGAVAVRKEKDGEHGYPVNFIKDIYGEWKIMDF